MTNLLLTLLWVIASVTGGTGIWILYMEPDRVRAFFAFLGIGDYRGASPEHFTIEGLILLGIGFFICIAGWALHAYLLERILHELLRAAIDGSLIVLNLFLFPVALFLFWFYGDPIFRFWASFQFAFSCLMWAFLLVRNPIVRSY